MIIQNVASSLVSFGNLADGGDTQTETNQREGEFSFYYLIRIHEVSVHEFNLIMSQPLECTNGANNLSNFASQHLGVEIF